ncbi:50S ribosomal protein L35 [Candidatus Peregrinibacteria bacterium]|nr:50S ribosomal protein L35 [Candidatus Peregrinibacteria bacterium]
MPAKAKPGKQRSASGAKKRFKLTGKKRFAHQKAAHNHLLQQKARQQKRLNNQMILSSPAYDKTLKRMLPNK